MNILFQYLLGEVAENHESLVPAAVRSLRFVALDWSAPFVASVAL
jgi:hypothetical protein